SGQSCIAAKRFIVHKAQMADFEKAFLEEWNNQKIGDPHLEETTIGPLARSDLPTALFKQFDRAVQTNGTTVLSKLEIPQKGFYFPPTVVRVHSERSILFQEETFGPLAPI